MTESSMLQKKSFLPTALLTFLCLLYSAWVLSLPLFPTQDGPMHLYFMHVLHSLLFHQDRFYEQYYYVRHVLPPYALYYYLLMALSSVFPLLVADKLVICLFFFLFAFGVRFLGRSIGPQGDNIALLSTLLFFNWPLTMGFVNFCLSTSLALWTLGLWCRAAGKPGWTMRAGFVLMCYVIMLTHPVPLLAVLGFCGVELLVRLARQRSWRTVVSDGVALLLAAGTLAYVRLFTTRNLTAQVHASNLPFWREKLTSIKMFAVLHWITIYEGRTLSDLVYRGMFYLLLATCLYVAVRQFRQVRQTGEWTVAQTWTIVAIGFLLLLPWIPSDLNNSAYFAERLELFIWISALAAAAGWRGQHRLLRPAVALFAIVGAVVTLGIAQQRIRPVAREIAMIETMPAIPTHSVALLMHDPDYGIPLRTTYDPYFWSGVRMLRRTNSIMWNTPWLDLAIIPLGPRPTMPTYRLTPRDLETPPALRDDMSASPVLQEYVDTQINAAVFGFGTKPGTGRVDPLLGAAVGWTCRADGNFSICTEHR